MSVDEINAVVAAAAEQAAEAARVVSSSINEVEVEVWARVGTWTKLKFTRAGAARSLLVYSLTRVPCPCRSICGCCVYIVLFMPTLAHSGRLLFRLCALFPPAYYRTLYCIHVPLSLSQAAGGRKKSKAAIEADEAEAEARRNARAARELQPGSASAGACVCSSNFSLGPQALVRCTVCIM